VRGFPPGGEGFPLGVKDFPPGEKGFPPGENGSTCAGNRFPRRGNDLDPEFCNDRCVIRWMFESSWFFVDPAIDTTVGKRRRCPDMVDAKPLILFKRMMEIIPPRILPCVLVYLSKNVDKAPLFKILDRLALRLGKVHLVFPQRHLPNVQLMRSNVQVAAQQHIVLKRKTLIKILPKPFYPIKLESEFIRTELRSVGHINIYNSDAVDRPGEKTFWRILFVARKIPLKVSDRMFRNDGDAVIGFLAQKRDVRITDSLNSTMRKLDVDCFSFLQAENIRLICSAPIEHLIEARIDPVDVPSGHLHNKAQSNLSVQ